MDRTISASRSAPTMDGHDEVLSFLHKVLPEGGSGYYCGVTLTGWDRPKRRENKRFFHRVDELVDWGREQDRAGLDVYFATATFAQPTVRTKENALWRNTLLADVDIGKEGAYPTGSGAMDALKAFCDATGLPAPLLVNSGRGRHAYWLLDSSISREEHNVYGKALAALYAKHGLKNDPCVATDFVRIMRLPGTRHLKSPQSPLPVRLLKNALSIAQVWTPQQYADLLTAGWAAPAAKAQAKTPLLGPIPAYLRALKPPSIPPETRPEAVADADIIADKCAQIGHFRATGCADAGDEPLWRHAMSVVGRCVDGARLAHDWSRLDSRYDQAETQGKLDDVLALSGPPLCSTLETATPSCVARCAACLHKGHIVTPLKLGEPITPSAGGRIAVPPEIAELNENYFYISGGKAVVGHLSKGEGGGESVLLQGAKDFAVDHGNKSIWLNDKAYPLGLAWLRHAARRTYSGFGFDPKESRDLPGGKINLWRGWGVEPKPGQWPRLRQHIRDVLAAGDEGHSDYNLRWIAWKLQNPGERPEVALVFKSRQGAGKGILFNALNRAFGAQGRTVSNPKHVTGAFNAHLRGACLLVLDEAFWAGDKAARGTLFNLITDPVMTIEAKGVDATPEDNHLGVVMLTNADWAVPAEAGSRRFAVFNCSDAHAMDMEPDEDRTRYFKALAAEIDGGGLAAMMHDLLALDLKGWHPRDGLPRTQALQEQKLQSIEGFPRWWCDVLTRGSLPCDPRAPSGATRLGVSGEDRYFFTMRDAVEDARHLLGNRGVNPSSVSLGCFLTKLGFTSVKNTAGERGRRVRPLAECRAEWVKRWGAWDWGDDSSDDWR